MRKCNHKYVCLAGAYNRCVGRYVVVCRLDVVGVDFAVVVLHVAGAASAHLNVKRRNVIPRAALEFRYAKALAVQACVAGDSPVAVFGGLVAERNRLCGRMNPAAAELKHIR